MYQRREGAVYVICDGIGDLIYAEPAIRLCKRLNDDAVISLVTWPSVFADIHRYHPAISQVIELEGTAWDQELHVRSQIARQHDHVVVLDNIARLSEPCVYCGAGDLNRWYRVVNYLNLHLVDVYSLYLNGVLPPRHQIVPVVYHTDEDQREAETVEPRAPFVVIFPEVRTNQEGKQWPLDLWAALVELILRKFPTLHVVSIMVDPSRFPSVSRRLASRYKVVSGLNIRAVKCLLEKTCLVISQQSGGSALADAARAPGVMLHIGSPGKACLRLCDNVTVIDQKQPFSPHTVTLDDVWNAVCSHLVNVEASNG